MKYVKTLGLLAVAAAALMAFPGTASASTLTSPKGTAMTVGSSISATSTNTELHGPFTTVKCGHAMWQGVIKQNGTVGGTTNAGGETTTHHFGSCSSVVTQTRKLGTFEINKASEVFSTGTEIAVHTSVGECVYTTNNTKLFTLTEGNNPVLHHGSATVPRTSGSGGFFCGSIGTWTGNYMITSPEYLEVH